jgi:la-related protein 1
MAASTFSYAQAAKGMSTPVVQSKPTSGAATTAKDNVSAVMDGPMDSIPSWADDAESELQSDPATAAPEPQAQEPATPSVQPAESVEGSNISSPDLGASSASTVTKDDDVSSLPNASSDSTWDNKSQASTSVDKSADLAEKTSEKPKKGKNAPAKPLQEAPLPTVNVWQKRADELKSKTQKPSSSSSYATGNSAKKAESDAKVQSTSTTRPRSHGEDKSGHARKDTRGDGDFKKDSKTKPFEKESRTTASAQAPPPKRDQESWPTPETVISEDRKKAQEKDQKESVSAGIHGKHEWVKVPYTPSVVFNTPLPTAAGSRRGGRAGGRGGSQSGGRPTTYAPNGASQPEKDGSAPSVTTNGDHAKPEGTGPQEASPKSKRNGSAGSPTLKDGVPSTTSDKSARVNGSYAAEEFRPRTSSSAPDSNQPSHGNNFGRQYSNKPNKPRRGDASYTSDRRRDGEVSPTKDNTFDDRRNATAPHADASADGERRASTYHDGPNGHQHKQGRYSSYSGGRERGRGGGRGGRGSYANGHQYTSGHMSAQSTPSFALGPRSPTTFNPENPSFFAAPQGKYGRNGHRSQSVTTDHYRFGGPYQGGPPVAPLQGYNMYDYSMMQQPMSAMPYTPYVDQFALFSMITTQVYVMLFSPHIVANNSQRLLLLSR